MKGAKYDASMPGLLTRIRDSHALLNGVTWSLASYLKLAFRTTKWTKIGFDDLSETLDAGEPVIIICWHQRLVYAPLSWDHSKGQAATLRSASRAGLVSAGIQERLGMLPVKMHDDTSNLSGSRKVAKLMKKGVTLGITADGPEGPARVFNGAGLEWARLTGKPIYLFAFATKGHRLWNTWDKLMFPRPFTKGVMIYKRWDKAVPRKPSGDEMEALRAALEADLNAITAQADATLIADRP